VKETRADTRTALLQALGLHLVLFVPMFAGLSWTRSNVAEAARGEVIEADLVDPSALSAAMRSALERKPERPQPAPVEVPEPLPEPVAEDMPPPVPDPEPIEQERVQRDAESPEVAKVAVEQEERRKQPDQADLDAQRQQQLQEIRRQRELAARERTQAEMRAMQLADARNAANAAAQADAAASRPRGDPDSRSGKQAAYIVAIRDAVLRQWTRPESVPLGVPCQVAIRQIPGGEVVQVEVSASCPYDQLGKRSLEAAILKASPLPYAGFEDVFVRDPVLKFRAEDL
jgi:colicin import membrane protein